MGKRMIIVKKNCAIVKYGALFAAEFSSARIPVMLRNNATDLFISNCTVGVLPKRRKSGIATCAYLSSYNSFYEAALFVQHTLACGVDKVILYEGTPVDYLPVLKQLYGNRLLLYRFTWPQFIDLIHKDSPRFQWWIAVTIVIRSSLTTLSWLTLMKWSSILVAHLYRDY